MPAVVEEFFSTTIAVSAATAVVEVAGDLDVDNGRLLQHALQQLELRGVRQITVDLQDCSYLDADGAAVLAAARHRLARRGGRLALRGGRTLGRHLLAQPA